MGLTVSRKTAKNLARLIDSTFYLYIIELRYDTQVSGVVHTARSYPSFHNIKQLGLFLPPDWMLVHRMVIHSYTATQFIHLSRRGVRCK